MNVLKKLFRKIETKIEIHINNLFVILQISLIIAFLLVFIYIMILIMVEYSFELSSIALNNFYDLFKSLGYIITGFVAITTLKISYELLKHRRMELIDRRRERFIEDIKQSFIYPHKPSTENKLETTKINNIENWIYPIIDDIFYYMISNDNIRDFYKILNIKIIYCFEKNVFALNNDYYRNEQDDENINNINPNGLEKYRNLIYLSHKYLSNNNININLLINKVNYEYDKLLIKNLKKEDLGDGRFRFFLPNPNSEQ